MARVLLVSAMIALCAACEATPRAAYGPIVTVAAQPLAPATAASKQPEPAAPSAELAAAPEKAPPTDAQRLRSVIAEAKRKAKKDGFTGATTLEIPHHHAAILEYSESNDAANGARARVDLVALEGERVTTISGLSMQVMRSPQGQGVVWNMRGDGTDSVLVYGYSDGKTDYSVYDVVGDAFVKPSSVPQSPASMSFGTSESVPEFEATLLTLRVGRRRGSSDDYLSIEVTGYESWDGSAYARDLKAFEPLYRQKLEQARSIAQRVRTMGYYQSQQQCAIGIATWAANAFVAARMLGTPAASAIREADTIMQGYSLSNCSQYVDGKAEDWPSLRAKLLAARLPVLTRERPSH